MIVSPSLNLRSNSCFGFSFSFSICSRFFNHLKWSWRATFRSKLSDLSKKPTPMNADRPLSSWILRTKYLDESVTGSTAIPGYCSIGHLANSSPVILSSSFIVMLSPCDTNRMRPVQEGSCRFQSAALWQIANFEIIPPIPETWKTHHQRCILSLFYSSDSNVVFTWNYGSVTDNILNSPVKRRVEEASRAYR